MPIVLLLFGCSADQEQSLQSLTSLNNKAWRIVVLGTDARRSAEIVRVVGDELIRRKLAKSIVTGSNRVDEVLAIQVQYFHYNRKLAMSPKEAGPSFEAIDRLKVEDTIRNGVNDSLLIQSEFQVVVPAVGVPPLYAINAMTSLAYQTGQAIENLYKE